MKKNSIANAAIGLIALTFISKILGFVREMVISYMYGASAMSDAYSMANSVAVLIVTGLASGIMTAYIPESMEITDKKEQDRFTSNVMNTLVVGTGIIAAICIIFSRQIVSVLGMGFTEYTQNYTVVLLRYVFIASICIFVIYIISGWLNTRGNFSYGGVQLIITNLIIIIAVIGSRKNPIKLGIGYLIAYIIPMLLGFYLLKRYKFSYSWNLNLSDTRLKKLYVISLIAFLGTNVVKLDVMIDRVFASSLGEGTVAAINYAFTLTSIFPEVFIMSIATVGYPKVSEWFAQKKVQEFGNYVSNMLLDTVIILLPIMVFFLEMGEWIVRILFERGAFDRSDTLLTVEMLNGYSYGMLGIGMSLVLCKVFFARKEEWVPAICLGAGIGMNFILNTIIGNKGAYEVALSTSISVGVSTILMFLILIWKCPEIKIGNFCKNLVKIVVVTLVVWCIVSFGMDMCMPLEESMAIIKILALAAIVVVATVIYVVLLWLWKVEEIKQIFNVLQKKFKR